MNSNIVAISVGGSLIVPDKIDIAFLKNLQEFVIQHIKEGKRFVIICGGGETARKYQRAAQKLTTLNDEEIDWLGIHATRMNAELIKTLFHKMAHPEIITDPTKKIDFREKILIAAGWKPGFSTDYDAVLLAKQFGAQKLINLTNVDYVYDKDPTKFKDANPIQNISWGEFINLFGTEWKPGLHAPFDPVAAQEASKLNMEVAIMNGNKLEQVAHYLETGECAGTLIHKP